MAKRFSWEFKQEQLAKSLRENPISELLQWSTMRESFFIGDTCAARNELAGLNARMLEVVEDPGVGSPSLIVDTKTSGTYVRQASALQEWENQSEERVDTMMRIFEFGGGYGVMPVICQRLGFKGAYTIYDLPVVSKLQSWYLGEVGVYNVRLTNDIIPNSHDLFVALCSLSEVPAETRTAVLNAHPATHYLILVQHEWDGVNNVTWFKNWFDEENLHYSLYPAPHVDGQYYFIC